MNLLVENAIQAIECSPKLSQKEVDQLIEVIHKQAEIGVTVDRAEQVLVDFFQSRAGAGFATEGDFRHWTPAYTAVHFLKILAADGDIKFLKRTVEQERVNINRILDSVQNRFNEIFNVK